MTTLSRVLCSLLLGSALGLMAGTPLVTPSALAGPAPAPRQKTVSEETPCLKIHVRYPQFGIKRIDEDIRQWTSSVIAGFRSEYGGEALGATQVPYLLDITYEVVTPPGGLISVIWQEASYTAGAHGQLNMLSFNYAPDTGAPVALLDLFRHPSAALQSMSAYAYTVLAEQLGDMKVEDMLRDGLLPEADNFATFAVTPDGLRVYFPPYQVAPWAAGPQSVDIPLSVLQSAGPVLRYWGK